MIIDYYLKIVNIASVSKDRKPYFFFFKFPTKPTNSNGIDVARSKLLYTDIFKTDGF